MLRIILLVLVLHTSFARAEEPPDVVDLLLTEAGIDRRDLRADPLSLLASRDSSGQPPLLRGIFSDPLKSGFRATMFAERFRRRMDSPHRLMMHTTGLAGADLTRGYIGNPLRQIDARLAAAEDPLAAAMADLAEVTAPFDWEASLPPVADFPNPARHEVARLIAAITQAERFRRRAFVALPAPDDAEGLMRQVLSHSHSEFDAPDYRKFIADIEMEALAAGMLDLVAAVEDFDDFIAGYEQPVPISWSIQTPLGNLLYTSLAADDLHELRDPLLLIDLAGNDTYQVMNLKPRAGISVIFDATGADVHGGGHGVGGASAVLGFGILWDREGNDKYGGGVLSQAACLFGAALLFDGNGDDLYDAFDASQSFALAGAALLIDAGGDDSFTSLSRSQGSAGSRAGAVLFDAAGNDVYTLKPEPLLNPSAQLPDRNNSMGQGCGWGLRADLADGRSLAGGVGALIDLEGNDTYSGTVFCQGAGFHEGVGILFDGAGDDQYAGAWYTQAAAAHRAVGILIDRGNGNDRHTATHYTSISAAHDGSVAYLHNEGGNDVYVLNDLGLGAAQDNGIALFIDGGGDDEYEMKSGAGHGFGSARITHYGTARELSPSAGLFFDLGGTDRYTVRRPGPSDGSRWRGAAVHPGLQLPAEAAAGIDGEYPADPFPLGARSPESDADDKMLRDALVERRAYRATIKSSID